MSKMDFPYEIKWIKGFERLYEIDNRGNIFSHYLYGSGEVILTRRKLISISNNRGYLSVRLYKNQKAKIYRINILVAEAFISNPFHFPFVLHKDDDPSNNWANNLEWGTASKNMKDAYDRGRKDKKGEKHHMAKMNNKKVLEARDLYKTGLFTHRELGDMFGITRKAMGDIVNRKRWKHI